MCGRKHTVLGTEVVKKGDVIGYILSLIIFTLRQFPSQRFSGCTGKSQAF